MKSEYYMNPKKCFNCSKKLEYKQRKNKFCSHSCSSQISNKNKTKNKKVCIQCNKDFSTRGKFYCSLECSIFHKKIEKYSKFEKDGFTNSITGARAYLRYKFGCKCSICNITEWCGKTVPLVMDHIDGNSENNQLTNLRLVCGNCDMQLPTYKGKNAGKGRHSRRQRYKEGKSY